MFTEFVLNLIIVMAGLAGVGISYHIVRKKRSPGPFICPLRFDCQTVTQSEYSKLLGVPLERIGMMYYSLVTLSYTSFLIKPELHFSYFGEGVLIVTISAFVFSILLTYVQAYKLRQWCSWCLVSAGVCTVIFLSILKIAL